MCDHQRVSHDGAALFITHPQQEVAERRRPKATLERPDDVADELPDGLPVMRQVIHLAVDEAELH